MARLEDTSCPGSWKPGSPCRPCAVWSQVRSHGSGAGIPSAPVCRHGTGFPMLRCHGAAQYPCDPDCPLLPAPSYLENKINCSVWTFTDEIYKWKMSRSPGCPDIRPKSNKSTSEVEAPFTQSLTAGLSSISSCACSLGSTGAPACPAIFFSTKESKEVLKTSGFSLQLSKLMRKLSRYYAYFE